MYFSYKLESRSDLFLGSESWVLKKNNKSHMQAIEMKFLKGFKQCAQCGQIQYTYKKQELNISSVMDNIIYNKDNWTEKEGRQAPSSTIASPLQHLVQSVLYGINHPTDVMYSRSMLLKE